MAVEPAAPSQKTGSRLAEVGNPEPGVVLGGPIRSPPKHRFFFC